MIKLKLVAWDQYEAVYSWNGFHIYGSIYSDFLWSFPEINYSKAVKNNLDATKILHRYKISRFGTTLQEHFEGECKKIRK